MRGIACGHQNHRAAALESIRNLISYRPKAMTPINEFLILKEMTASDLLNLGSVEESAFWDEYQKWRKANIDEVAEIAKMFKELPNAS
jgi:hypothetical protein